MNRWGRIVWSLALLATAAWVAGGLTGFRVTDTSSLAEHTLWSFAALLALTLTHVWVAVYLVTLERLLRRPRELDIESSRQLRSARRRGSAAASLALLAAVAQFTAANALYPARLDSRWHLTAGALSVVVLGLALRVERTALRRAGAVVARLETPIAG